MSAERLQVSRRRLLIGAGGAAVAAGAGAVTVFDLFGGTTALSALDRDDVSSQLGTRLGVGAVDGTGSIGDLTVVEIAELPTAIDEPARQFAFRLVADRPLGLDQDTYRLTHRRFGSTLLFLSPIDDGDDGAERYEVLVNRPTRLAHLETPR